TFLWWANLCADVHEGYQSFLPPDVTHVADHAKRAVSAYPLCEARYYGVDYAGRAANGVPVSEIPARFVPPALLSDSPWEGLPAYAANDLSWYANIPVPTSYMAMGSHKDFFGGYDHKAHAGVVHIANHHISPGKKQWTWGNHEFGYAWDRNLSDDERPYIELMAGVYTDNQPDFSFLQPGETKTWSQYWYPIQKIGAAQHANLDCAVRLEIGDDAAKIGVSVTSVFEDAEIQLLGLDFSKMWRADLSPSAPFVTRCEVPAGVNAESMTLRVLNYKGREILKYAPGDVTPADEFAAATEPPMPAEITSADELYLTGLHLEQYRHATRSPVPYWEEALRRDPMDARCNNALGLWRLRRGELELAEAHFRKAIERLTFRNPNPYDGEPYYNLGMCLRFQLDATPPSKALFDAAYAAFYKAAWNQAWGAAAYHAIAELDCRRGNWADAIEHLDRSLRLDSDRLGARDLKAVALSKLTYFDESDYLIAETLRLDPLDGWARTLLGKTPAADLQALLDIIHDQARAGLYAEAIALIERVISTEAGGDGSLPTQSWGAAPMLCYTLGWLNKCMGKANEARRWYQEGAAQSTDYCFPARLEEIAILEAAIRANPKDAQAPYYLGCLLYDRRRHVEAIGFWERSVAIDPSFSIPWRNLGIGYFNIAADPKSARDAYNRAVAAAPDDARLLFERDQLWKRMGVAPEERLRALAARQDLVRRRDDLCVEMCALYNQTDQPWMAMELLQGRRFQPWEGGEGQALGQYVRTFLALGRVALTEGDPAEARRCFEAALTAPAGLSEAKHLLANQSDIHYWLGEACDQSGDTDAARTHWTTAATARGDFQEMSVRSFSEMTYFSALAWRRLGDEAQARSMLSSLLEYAKALENEEAKIDYFATSLPTMLLFDDDIQKRQETAARFLQAQALAGLGEADHARKLLAAILESDPSHALAAEMLRSIEQS
ncbi:MAG: DUF5107 domain-containing protein, partial [Capsulimonas sp.]|uniref:DUF5107 domain-containing protein n=1 Tax=Capsulimonas sp. TaxID=2494211 RepID=UPI003264B011